MQRSIPRATRVATLVAAVALLVAGCSATPSGNATNSGGTSPLTYRSADGTCSTQPNAGVDEASAESFLTPFIAGPSGLYTTEKLPHPIDASTTVAFLNNGSVIAGIMEGFLQQATTAAGVHFQNVDTGEGADTINSALNSVVENKPNILIAAAVDATFWQDQLKQLEANGTIVVYIGSDNAAQFGLPESLFTKSANQINGDVLAASALYFTCGTATNFVFYSVPELTFSQTQYNAAKDELAKLCPNCTLRSVDISILDPSPADKIVSDLQAHPDTQFFITPADQYQIGLAQKAQLAGITNAKGIGQSTIAANIQQIGAGEQTAGFAVDYATYTWMALDEGFRRLEGEKVTYSDWAKVVGAMSRIITPASAGQYTTEAGFIANPNLSTAFTALWR